MMQFQGFKITTEPAAEPVTLAEVKEQLRLLSSDDDPMITALIIAARQEIERYLHRALIEQTIQMSLDFLPSVIRPVRPPLIEVVSIEYVDTAGDTQTLDSDLYRVDNLSIPGRITRAHGVTWPTTQHVINAVLINFKAGYGTSESNVPAPIRQAIKSMAIDMYEHPEANAEIKLNVNKQYQRMLNSYKLTEFY